MMVQEWTQSLRFDPEEHVGNRQGDEVVELEQKIARGALGGGGEPGDLCKKSLLPNKSMGSQGGELEKLAEGDEEYMDSQASHWDLESCNGGPHPSVESFEADHRRSQKCGWGSSLRRWFSRHRGNSG